MPDLLIEIGCEELPSSACREAIAQAPGLMDDALSDLQLAAGPAIAWVAPRRITVFAEGVADRQGGAAKSVRGPAASAAFDESGAPTKAAEGFARGQGVDVADLVVREDPDAGRDFVWVEKEGDDAPLVDLVPGIARRVLEGLRFGKTMRWGDGRGLRFSRPVRWITAKAGSDTVTFEVAGIPGGGQSMGHRFLGGPVQVTSADSYRDELRATGNVLPDQLQFMLQVGFDAFDIGERFPLETWQKASRQMSLAYQRGLFRRGSEAEIWTERHTDAEPWLEQPHAG